MKLILTKIIFFAGIIRIVIGLAVLVGNGPWGSTAIQIVVAVEEGHNLRLGCYR